MFFITDFSYFLAGWMPNYDRRDEEALLLAALVEYKCHKQSSLSLLERMTRIKLKVDQLFVGVVWLISFLFVCPDPLLLRQCYK